MPYMFDIALNFTVNSFVKIMFNEYCTYYV